MIIGVCGMLVGACLTVLKRKLHGPLLALAGAASVFARYWSPSKETS